MALNVSSLTRRQNTHTTKVNSQNIGTVGNIRVVAKHFIHFTSHVIALMMMIVVAAVVVFINTAILSIRGIQKPAMTGIPDFFPLLPTDRNPHSPSCSVL